MVKERDKLLGVPANTPSRSSQWRTVAAVIVLASAVALAFLLGRSTAPPQQETNNRLVAQPATAVAGKVTNQASVPAATKQPAVSVPARPAATYADFLITDRLLANPRVYDDFEGDTVQTSVCLGDGIRIANVASRRVGLIDTPDASDATVTLGVVEPGGVFILRPAETGTFFISAAGLDGLLFRYVAERCSRR